MGLIHLTLDRSREEERRREEKRGEERRGEERIIEEYRSIMIYYVMVDNK